MMYSFYDLLALKQLVVNEINNCELSMQYCKDQIKKFNKKEGKEDNRVTENINNYKTTLDYQNYMNELLKPIDHDIKRYVDRMSDEEKRSLNLK